MKDFSRSQAVTYTVNVVICQEWCKIELMLLQTTNMKWCMVYRIVAIPMTLSDLQGHSPTACLFNWQCVAGSRYKCDSVAHSSKTAKNTLVGLRLERYTVTGNFTWKISIRVKRNCFFYTLRGTNSHFVVAVEWLDTFFHRPTTRCTKAVWPAKTSDLDIEAAYNIDLWCT